MYRLLAIIKIIKNTVKEYSTLAQIYLVQLLQSLRWMYVIPLFSMEQVFFIHVLILSMY